MIFNAGTVLFCAPGDELGLGDARKYIADKNLNSDKVKIVRTGDFISVKTKIEIDLK